MNIEIGILPSAKLNLKCKNFISIREECAKDNGGYSGRKRPPGGGGEIRIFQKQGRNKPIPEKIEVGKWQFCSF